MRKYDTAKFLVPKKARVSLNCNRCGLEIGSKTIYYKETLGRIHEPDKMIFKDFCANCYRRFGSDELMFPEQKSLPKSARNLRLKDH